MAAFTTRSEILQKQAQGKGLILPVYPSLSGTVTAATASVGHFSNSFHVNQVGTTVPGTLQTIPIPAGTANLNTIYMEGGIFSVETMYLCYFYKLGTLSLTTTGDQFTHDAGFTGPLLRTRFGAASTAINLLPMLYLTTATSTTAPVIIMKTAAGGAGYVDDQGNNIVGTKSHTFPAAATVAQSLFFLRPEDNDPSIRDMTAIQVTTASATGAATIYGVELLCPIPLSSQSNSLVDTIFGGLSMTDLVPAVPTTGTVTSYLGTLCTTNAASSQQMYFVTAVLNN